MSKSMTGKIWKSLFSKVLLMGAVFAFFYVIGDSLHIIPQSAKDFVSFLAANINLWAFLLCFGLGSYILILFLMNKRGQRQ